uniref:Jouberin isoform X2 n=1 Tax=Pogona vitticeps TaxID=103695 RepID=A0ABM5G4H6_9SAUR
MKMPAESEAKAKTKVRFEEIFRSHAALTNKNKSKKKQLSVPENIVLETLTNQLDPSKEGENDEVNINSTYNPEETNPQFTKNKLGNKALIPEKINNNVVSAEESKQKKSKNKKKKTELPEQLNEEEQLCETELNSFEKQIHVFSKKKAKSILQADSLHQKEDSNIKGALNGVRVISELDEEEQLIQAYEQQVAEEEANAIKKKIKKKLKEQMSEFTSGVQSHEVVLNNEVSKKKKKKKEVPVISEAQTSGPEEESNGKNRSLERPLISKFKEDVVTEEQELVEQTEQRKSKGKKSKRKSKKALEDDQENADEKLSQVASGTVSAEPKPAFDDSLVLGVYIHRTDRLKTDLMVSHPMVKIHVVDQKSGLYVKKENSSRPVSSFYEQETVGHILPIMTQPYDFKQFKSTLPEWEEQIIFNERFNYFIQDAEESPKMILFFEILDFLSMNDAKSKYKGQAHESGFRKICWAFLKLVGANGVLNVGGKLRLQLYSPPRNRSQISTVEVYDWWAKYPRIHYPSTLYVTVKGIKLPDHVDPSLRSMMAVQQEYHSPSFLDLQSEVSRKVNNSGPKVEKQEPFKWSKLPGQVCRIPNKYLFSLRTGDMGCFCISFSEDGRTLAAGCAGRYGYPVVLYEIPSGEFLREFYGHLNIVYDLCWSKDNQHLLTASSDGTARMWKIEAQMTSAMKVFPHPSFVYTAKYHPVVEYIVVTGCYDSVMRVWNAKVKEIHGQLLQEFDGHRGFINTLCFDAEGYHMFSGDSTGLIIVWNTYIKENSQSLIQHWGIDKEVKSDDIKVMTPINHLEVHPNGRRLLIHARDSTVRIMDLRIMATKKYIGATNYREKICSTLTPCGTFLFSGSEDGKAYVWNAETGDQVAVYSDLSFTSPLRGVAFHPHEHMVSFCAFGQNQPILVYIYDYKVAQQDPELVKDFNGLHLSRSSRAPQILNHSAGLSVPKDSMMSPADRFASFARVSMRMQKVKQKLESVTASSTSLVPSPSQLSPQSKLRLAGALGEQWSPLYPLPTQSGSFVPVGNPFSRTPSAGLRMNAELTAAACVKGDTSSIPVQETVVALYDYTAHRSDELTFHSSDIIQVLYKDNDKWWFGSLANGQQGYFPASCVVGETLYEKQLSPGVAEDSAPFLSSELGEVASPAMPEMPAAISKSEDQRFVSENDTGYLNTQGAKRKTRKKGIQTEEKEYKANLITLDNFPSNVAEDNPKKNLVMKKKKRSVKTTNASGMSNEAFQLDSSNA